MMRIRALILVGIALTLQAAPASATWTPLLPLGGSQLFSDPSCASPTESGTAVCAAIGPAQRLIADRYDGTKWTGWVELGGTVGSAPSCFDIEANEVWCGVRDTDGRLVTYTNNGSVWSGPNVIGGVLADAPSCVSLNTVTALCAARAIGGGLFSAEFKGTKLGFGGVWTILPLQHQAGMDPVTAVSCASDGLPLADAFCIYDGGTPTIVHRFIGSSSTWDTALGVLPETPLGPAGCVPFGTYELGPPLTELKSDNMLCYATLRDSYLWYAANNRPDAAGQSGGPNNFIDFSPTPLLAYVHSFSCAPASISLYAGIDEIYHTACAATGIDGFGLIAFDIFGDSQKGYIETVASLGSSPKDSFAGTPSCFVIAPEAAQNGVMCVSRNVENVAESTTGP